MNMQDVTVVIESTESAAVGGFAKCPCCGIELRWKQVRCLCGVGLHWKRVEEMNSALNVRSLAADRDDWRTLV